MQKSPLKSRENKLSIHIKIKTTKERYKINEGI